MKGIKINVKIGINNAKYNGNKNRDYPNNQGQSKDISRMNKED